MIEFVKNNDAPHFLILTECSMGDNIAAEYPDKDLLRLCSFRCPYMNTITLENTLKALQEEIFETSLEKAEEIIKNKFSEDDQDRIVDEYLKKVVA